MKIGALNTRITFQRLTFGRDRYGNHRNIWTDCFTAWATINTDTYGEEEGDEVTFPTETINFTTRWCTELDKVTSTGYRILCEGQVYNIIYINHMGYRHNSLKFVCHLQADPAGAGQDSPVEEAEGEGP